MFNRQEYVNWLQGVANHEKPNLHINNNVTEKKSNEPVEVDEGFWGGIDKIGQSVGRGTSKVKGWANKIEKSRFGTEFGAVGASARKRSQSFYGHGPAADTGFGKPVGHNDAKILRRRDNYRNLADNPGGVRFGQQTPAGDRAKKMEAERQAREAQRGAKKTARVANSAQNRAMAASREKNRRNTERVTGGKPNRPTNTFANKIAAQRRAAALRRKV